MTEWTGNQQLWFLLQSCGVGGMVGMLFDVLTGCGRASLKRYMVFFLDVLFGLLAALITFFGALVITDGRMHPLLFTGVLAGMLTEHFLIGRFISKLIQRVVWFLRHAAQCLHSVVVRMELRFDQMGMNDREQKKSKVQKRKKSAKNFLFFKKST